MPIGPTLPSVLLVEDHHEMRTALRDWLLASFRPLRLSEARSMEEALRQAEQATPDLALVNAELPGTNGIETARALRRRHPSSNVVLMSSNDSDALRMAAIDAGAVAFIRKRDLTASLMPIVSRLLSGKPNSLLG